MWEDATGGACGTQWENRNAHRDLMGKLDGRRPLGNPVLRWKNNIEMGIRDI